MHAELHFLTSVLSIVKQIQVYHIDQMYKSKTSMLEPSVIIQIWKIEEKKKVPSETWLRVADKIKSHITKIDTYIFLHQQISYILPSVSEIGTLLFDYIKE